MNHLSLLYMPHPVSSWVVGPIFPQGCPTVVLIKRRIHGIVAEREDGGSPKKTDTVKVKNKSTLSSVMTDFWESY